MSRWVPFRRLFGPDPGGDVDDELSFHLEMRERELRERGEPAARARELALARFGDYEASRTECVAIGQRRRRRLARAEYLGELRQDVRYALRSLARTPGFTVVGVLTLALGIGASSAIFSVVNAVLLRSLPFADPAQLYVVKTMYPDGTGYDLSAPDFMSIAEQSRVFENVVAWTSGVRPLLGRGEPREVAGALVSRDFFEALGMPLALGRSFRAEDHQPGRAAVAILDHGFWQQEFGGSPAALEAELDIAGVRYDVIGVLSPGARMGSRTQLYAPLEYDETFSAATGVARRGEFLSVLGRARTGTAAAQVSADMRRLGEQLRAEFPDTNDRLSFDAFSFRDEVVGKVQLPLLVLLGAVGLVVLIACANVANLLLARASAREGELAVRASLGAGRSRLVRQLVTEALVLGVLGGAAGLLVAYGGTRLIARASLAEIPRLSEATLDARVLLFTLATTLATVLVFGLTPALHATGRHLMGAIREEGRGALGASGQRLRSALIVVEMALAVMLLVGAGLLIRSFVQLTRVDPGFRSEQAISFRLSLQGPSYPDGAQVRLFTATLLEQLAAIPGVSAAGATSNLPLEGLGAILGPFNIEGGEPLPDDVNSEIAVASITPDYFRALGSPVLHGRTLSPQDRNGGPPVAVLNEAGVRRWFKGDDPVGRRVILGDEPIEVVGVVRDQLQHDPGTPAVPQLYLPFEQRSTRTIRIVLRTPTAAAVLAPRVTAAVHALDHDLPVSDYAALQDLVDRSVARPRFYTALLALFAGIALALAAIGIFGVMSYSVAQRTPEISLRMALGAPRASVLRLIVGRALWLSLLGLALGTAGALALGRVLQSQLFGVEPVDPLTLAAAFAVLSGSAVLASYLPARRAARLDPGLALRGG